MSSTPPETFNFSNTYIVCSLLGSVALSYGLRYAVLSLVSDPKAPPHKRGRWDGRPLDFAWFAWLVIHIVRLTPIPLF